MRQRGTAPPKSQILTCGTCGRQFSLDQTAAAPFCSERCKLIDLGRWLDEEISVPHEGGPEGDEPARLDQGDVE